MEFHVLLSFPKQQATRLCLDFLPFIAWIQNCQYWQLLWAVFNFTVGNTVTKLPRQPLGSYPSWKLQSYFWGGGAKAPSGPEPPHSRGFQITPNDATQSVGLLWMSDQPVAEISTGVMISPQPDAIAKTTVRSPFFVRHGGHCCRGNLVGRTTF